MVKKPLIDFSTTISFVFRSIIYPSFFNCLEGEFLVKLAVF